MGLIIFITIIIWGLIVSFGCMIALLKLDRSEKEIKRLKEFTGLDQFN